MKRIKNALIVACSLLCVASCTKETILSVSQTSFSFDKNGGNTAIVVSANKLWTASSNQGWCKVSPSSGDGSKQFDTSVSLSCEANTTSESRTCSITFTSEDKIATVSVTQSEGDAIILSQTEYELSSAAQTIIVTVQHNVDYEIEIPDACKGWISVTETKALSSQGYQLSIAENDTYEKRGGSVTFKQVNGTLRGKITIKQAQTDALMVETTQYELSPEAQRLEIKVKSNVDFSVQIDAEAQSWISLIETKALNESTLTFSVALNDGDDRTGKILLTSSSITTEITVKQKGEQYVVFKDYWFEKYCVDEFDLNGDGRISCKEALEVEEMYVTTSLVTDISGIEFFENLVRLTWKGSYYYDEPPVIDLSKNSALQFFTYTITYYFEASPKFVFGNNSVLTELTISGTVLETIDVSTLSHLQVLNVSGNKLTSLDVSRNTDLVTLDCSNNQLTSLDVSNHTALNDLNVDKNPLKYLNASNTAISSFVFQPLDDGPTIETLDLSYCQLLEQIKSRYPTKISVTNLVLNNCPVLTGRFDDFSVDNLDLSYCQSIHSLRIVSTQYKNLNLSHCDGLWSLDALLMELDTLDLSYCTSLTSFPRGDVRPNDIGYDTRKIKTIKKLILNNCTALPSVGLYDCGLTSIEVNDCTNLSYLYCSNGQLTSLDVSTCPALQNFSCSQNQLTSLDVSKNPALEILDCSSNQLTSLDVSKNPVLKYLECSRNPLTSLDVSENVSLQDLKCTGTLLSILDVSNNQRLSLLYASDNPLLTEIWLKTGQTIHYFAYDSTITTLKYRD